MPSWFKCEVCETRKTNYLAALEEFVEYLSVNVLVEYEDSDYMKSLLPTLIYPYILTFNYFRYRV